MSAIAYSAGRSAGNGSRCSFRAAMGRVRRCGQAEAAGNADMEASCADHVERRASCSGRSGQEDQTEKEIKKVFSLFSDHENIDTDNHE